MSNVIVLDTETTSLDKPFCYDYSWIVMDKETGKIIDFKAFVVEQAWHNLPLFESAYYKEKREKYVQMMRRHEAIMDKFGYIMGKLKRDIHNFDVTEVYAYNSPFDDKVTTFNCDWYKCANPLDNIPVFDIWGYASQYITCSQEYKNFCEENERFTDTGNYKGSAEVVYQYLTGNPDFIEEHMGLFDSEIEGHILFECIQRGAEWAKEYPVNKVLTRPVLKPFTIKMDGNIVFSGDYLKKFVRGDVFYFNSK